MQNQDCDHIYPTESGLRRVARLSWKLHPTV